MKHRSSSTGKPSAWMRCCRASTWLAIVLCWACCSDETRAYRAARRYWDCEAVLAFMTVTLLWRSSETDIRLGRGQCWHPAVGACGYFCGGLERPAHECGEGFAPPAESWQRLVAQSGASVEHGVFPP